MRFGCQFTVANTAATTTVVLLVLLLMLLLLLLLVLHAGHCKPMFSTQPLELLFHSTRISSTTTVLECGHCLYTLQHSVEYCNLL